MTNPSIIILFGVLIHPIQYKLIPSILIHPIQYYSYTTYRMTRTVENALVEFYKYNLTEMIVFVRIKLK